MALSVFVTACGGFSSGGDSEGSNLASDGGPGGGGSPGGSSWSGIRMVGTSSSDTATRVHIGSDGSVIIAGQTQGTLPNNTKLGNNDAYVAKYSANGNLLWIKQFGSDKNETVQGLAIDPQGNVGVAGSSDGSLPNNTLNGVVSDAYVAKLNGSTGQVIWIHQFGSTATDVATGLAVDGSGNFYASGYVQAATSAALPGNTAKGGNDAFIAKITPGGTREWLKQLGTNSDDLAYAVWVDSSGTSYTVGTTTGTFAGNTSAGGLDAFLVKYNSSGVEQWVEQIGTSGADALNVVDVDSSGHIVVAGSTTGTYPMQVSQGGNDLVVAKVDKDSRNLIWVLQDGSSANDYATGVAIDGNQMIYVAGYTLGGFVGTNAGSSDGVLLRLNTNGQEQWARQFGSTHANLIWGLAHDSSGNAYIAGTTDGSINGSSFSGLSDGFVLSYSAAGSLR